MMPAAVFDCMVFVRAVANAKGPACAGYQLVRVGRLLLYVSPQIIAEVGDVPGRPKVGRKLPALTGETVAAFLRDVLGRATMLPGVPGSIRIDRDPKDEPYINRAFASDASYLVTWDRDLLDLMNDEGSRRQVPHMTILGPPALLRLFPRDSEETAPA